MQDLNQALLILLIGMLTVFLILALVVLTGWGLIRFTNSLIPTPKKTPRISIPRPTAARIPRKQLAAIAAAVEIVTGGAGKVEKIEKM